MDTERLRRSVTFSPKESAGRPPKIASKLVPLITEYLLQHRVTAKEEILRFLRERHGLSVCRDTLNDLLKKYELERLIQRPATAENCAVRAVRDQRHGLLREARAAVGEEVDDVADERTLVVYTGEVSAGGLDERLLLRTEVLRRVAMVLFERPEDR